MAELIDAKKKRKTAKGIFHRYYNSFEVQFQASSEEDAIAKVMSDMEYAYKDLEGKHYGLVER